MVSQTFYKLLQRQTYSCLSHKYGIYFTYSCLVIIIYSIFHFSEELLELTKDRYEAAFSIYHDNIASRSFQKQISSTLPVDIVYTWVNGSDPIFQKQLRFYQQVEAMGHSRSLCSDPNCVLLPIKFINHLSNLDESFSFISNFENNKSFNFFLSKTDYTESTYLVRNALLLEPIPEILQNENKLKEVLPKNLLKKLEYVYYTSEKKLVLLWFSDSSIVNEVVNKSSNSSLKYGIFFESNKIEINLIELFTEKSNEFSKNRFEDNEELRYSLRSVAKHAPWIRQIFIVTNGQIPSWLDINSPRVTLITHEQIFSNKNHLPTFSSPAIESHLHKIPGLADNFIYLNDDVMFGKEVWPEDFYTSSKGYKIYLSWPVPDCNQGCFQSWVKDGFCDLPCNTSLCDWDGGDCLGVNIRQGVGMTAARNPGYSGEDEVSTNYCHRVCATNWLADKFCDESCNRLECAFDVGDCGLKDFDQLFKVQLTSINGSTYYIEPGYNAFYIPFTNVFEKITSASYKDDGNMITASVSNIHHVVIILLRQNSNQTQISINLTGSPALDLSSNTPATNTSLNLLFTILANPSADKLNRTTPAPVVDKTYPFDFHFIPSVKPRTHLKNFWINSSFDPFQIDQMSLSDDQLLDFQKLKWQFENKILTEIGFKKETNKLMESRIKLHQSDDKRSNDSVIFRHQRRLASFEVNEDSEKLIRQNRKLLDSFGDSLNYVNRLYDDRYGHSKRRVLAHAPFYINKGIMLELQELFADEYDSTSSHRFRHPKDMQYSFSYYYFVMSEQKAFNASEIFDIFDTNYSGILSDRELRTLATRIFESPLFLNKLNEMENEIKSCASILYGDHYLQKTSNSTKASSYIANQPFQLLPEKYFDENMPQVTRELFVDCKYLTSKLNQSIGPQNRFKFQEFDHKEYVSFKMLNGNTSSIVAHLDEIRRSPKQFICLNDNIDYNEKDVATIKLAIKELLRFLYPVPSPFELPSEYRNRFLYINDLNDFKLSEKYLLNCLQYLSISLLVAIIILTYKPELNALYLNHFKKYIFPHKQRHLKHYV